MRTLSEQAAQRMKLQPDELIEIEHTLKTEQGARSVGRGYPGAFLIRHEDGRCSVARKARRPEVRS